MHFIVLPHLILKRTSDTINLHKKYKRIEVFITLVCLQALDLKSWSSKIYHTASDQIYFHKIYFIIIYNT